MKTGIALFSLILLFTFGSVELLKSNPDNSSETDWKEKNIWAIVVGISKYQNVHSLTYAHSDAISFYNYLLSPAGGRADTNRIKLLLDSNATSYNVIRAFQYVKANVKVNDLVYFYFAGHGDVENITDSELGYLICYSSPPNVYASGGSLPIDYLQECLRTFAKKKAKVIMIADACRAGKLAGGKEGLRQTALALQNEWEGITKILSCKPGENSQEGDKWGDGAGVFTYYLLRGLKGLAVKDLTNNKLTLLQLYNYLKDNVSRETGNRQNPKYSGDEDCVLSYIDKNAYQSLLAEKEEKDFTAVRGDVGFVPDISIIKDKFVKSQYYLFQYYLETNKLLNYNDKGKDSLNALYIYHTLKNNIYAEPIINTMKEALLAALQNKAQIVRNNCLNNNWDFSSRNIVYKDLEAALNLIDSNYFFYKHIKSSYLLWKSIKATIDGNRKECIGLMKECIALEPENPLSYFLIAWLYGTSKQLELAVINYDKAIKYSSNWIMPLNNKGFDLNELGKYEEAIKCFEKVIELDSNDLDPWTGIGNALEGLGKNEEAVEYYNRAIFLKPDFIQAIDYKVTVLNKLGRTKEANECFEKIMTIKPEDTYSNIKKGKILGKIGRTKEANECFEEALKVFNKDIDVKPDNSSVWYDKSCIQSLMKNKKEMLISLKKAIELGTNWKEKAKTDDDFKDYWQDSDFKKLVE
ncbi:MAG: tetratricopeptide repeat protein [Candidatus Kapabacteria bacterium]|nr:tetratricopeptide repeat protein [Candidatus Kapabacteria bacterium]